MFPNSCLPSQGVPVCKLTRCKTQPRKNFPNCGSSTAAPIPSSDELLDFPATSVCKFQFECSTMRFHIRQRDCLVQIFLLNGHSTSCKTRTGMSLSGLRSQFLWVNKQLFSIMDLRSLFLAGLSGGSTASRHVSDACGESMYNQDLTNHHPEEVMNVFISFICV